MVKGFFQGWGRKSTGSSKWTGNLLLHLKVKKYLKIHGHEAEGDRSQLKETPIG
jgi:hypothetical protein